MPQKPLPGRFSSPCDSPGFLLWRVPNVWQRKQREALLPFGITHTQFVALAVASWFGQQEPITQIRLSQLTGSDPMTISQIVRALENQATLKGLCTLMIHGQNLFQYRKRVVKLPQSDEGC